MPVNDITPYSEEELFAPGEQKSYTGDKLKLVALPLGGIGTGNVSIGGRGDLMDWEIFNRPGKNRTLLYTFPVIYAKTESGEPVSRVLESKLLPPFNDGGGMSPGKVSGLPRLSNAIFKGEYPFGYVDFRDDKLPVKVDLTAYNPFIPLNEKDSAIPTAILTYKVTNTSSERVNVTICWSMQNACGNDGVIIMSRQNANYGGQKNEFIDDGTLRGIKMTQSKYPEDDPLFGSLALTTTHKDITYLETWSRGGWWDDGQKFWDDFKADGELTDNGVKDASPENMSDITSLGLKVSLAPGESADLPFIFTWYFPNRINYWNREEEVSGKKLKNRYGDLWKDAWDVAGYVAKNMERLEKETRQFSNTLYSSTLPRIVTDAAGANMSIMRTVTGLFLEDNRFYGFEGVRDNGGCCPMNCTHVYNYEQAIAFLFPQLERTMREVDFTYNMHDDGKMSFRTHLPLGMLKWPNRGAADGQMGCILKLYREYLMSGDVDFLKSLYPGAKKAMEYAWIEWDEDQDGMMEAIQHNTYDIEFLGPNTMMGSLYLGALKAMEKIAAVCGDEDFSTKCRNIYEKGAKSYPETLWDGEFYIQKYEPENAPKYQYGAGCLSDQLLGQWFCEVVGLGYVFPEDQVKKTLESIFKYNWRHDLSDHDSCQRAYAVNDESGLLLCSWPKGGRPALPFVYADEVWTGIEYQVAAHLIYENMLEEGLTIVKGIRDRHDGIVRNPWNEFECGHHYARAMASWSLILALSGFRYNAPDKYIAFGPKVCASNFKCIYTTGSGWGEFSQTVSDSKLTANIAAAWGQLELQRIKLDIPSDSACNSVNVSLNGKTLEAGIAREDDSVIITLNNSCTINKNEALEITIA